MEPSCPLYFALYPAHHLLPGLQEYLGDTTPILTALEPPTGSSNGRRKKPDRERSSSGLRNSPCLVVGSRKLVFLHSTTSKWCRMKVGSGRRGGKEGVRGGVGGGWSEETEKEAKHETGPEGDNWSKEKEAVAAREETCVEGGVLVGSCLHRSDSPDLNEFLISVY